VSAQDPTMSGHAANTHRECSKFNDVVPRHQYSQRVLKVPRCRNTTPIQKVIAYGQIMSYHDTITQSEFSRSHDRCRAMPPILTESAKSSTMPYHAKNTHSECLRSHDAAPHNKYSQYVLNIPRCEYPATNTPSESLRSHNVGPRHKYSQ
jgi:hypothetical protein